METQFGTRFEKLTTKPGKDGGLPTVTVAFDMPATPGLMGELVQVFGQRVTLTIASAQRTLDEELDARADVNGETVDGEGEVIDGEIRMLPAEGETYHETTAVVAEETAGQVERKQRRARRFVANGETEADDGVATDEASG